MLLGLGNIFNGPFRQSVDSTLVLIRFIDMAMLFGAVWMIYYLWNAQNVFEEYCRIVFGVLVAMIFLGITRIYRQQQNIAGFGEVVCFLSTRGFALCSIMAVAGASGLQLWAGNSYSWIATWGGLALLMVLTSRSIYQYFLHWLKYRGSATRDGASLLDIERVVVQNAENSGNVEASDRNLPRLATVCSACLTSNHANDAIWPMFADGALHRALGDRGTALRSLIDRYAGKQLGAAANPCTLVSLPKLGIKVLPMDKYSKPSRIVRIRSWGLRSIEDYRYFESA